MADVMVVPAIEEGFAPFGVEGRFDDSEEGDDWEGNNEETDWEEEDDEWEDEDADSEEE